MQGSSIWLQEDSGRAAASRYAAGGVCSLCSLAVVLRAVRAHLVLLLVRSRIAVSVYYHSPAGRLACGSCKGKAYSRQSKGS
jgi:hypothetical protein